VPVSLAAAVPVMAACGFSINVLTLLAFVLGIGLVVDDAIVVLENAYRRHEEGEPLPLATARGTRQVAFAVVATTVVLVAVFVPIAFQTGTVGRLFREFGITLAAAVACSCLVALTLTPALSRRLIHRHDHDGPIARGLGAVLGGIERGYGWLLDRALSWRWAVIGVAVAVSLAAVALYVSGLVRRELAPVEDMGVVIVSIEAPQGATLAETRTQVEAVSAIIAPHAGDDGPVQQVVTIMPSFASPGQVNTAFMILRLKDWQDRRMGQRQLVEALNPQLFGLSGARIFAINRPSFGIRDLGQSFQAVIGADEHERARAWSQQVVAGLRGDQAERQKAGLGPRYLMPRDDVELTRPQLSVRVDRDRLAALGLTASDVGDALDIAFGERKSTTIEDRGQQYDVVLQAGAAWRQVPSDLDRIQLRSRTTGKPVPLSSVVAVAEVGVAKDLKRVDRRAAVTVSATLAPGMVVGDAVSDMRARVARDLPPTASLSWTGQAKEFVDSAGGQGWMFAAALLIVFLALAAQFESWIHPAIILTAVPLATAGALGALALTGQTLNIYSQIGIVMLVGLMAKNGILLVEFANQLRDQGRDVVSAAREAAAIRLRPILMTSIASIAGAMPLAFAHGAGSEGRAAIGTVIIGGLSLATVLTLFVVPVLYALVAGFSRPAGARGAELERLEREHPEAADRAEPSPRET
jgi:multidrug efflux pump